MLLLRRHSELFWQLVRYMLTGGLASIVNIGVYWILALQGMDPNLAWGVGFVAAVLFGYVVHSKWSFRGHGARDDLARTGGRFVIVALISFALNSFWVWLLVQQMDLPLWAPYLPVLTVTPLVIFALNRKWVFG